MRKISFKKALTAVCYSILFGGMLVSAGFTLEGYISTLGLLAVAATSPLWAQAGMLGADALDITDTTWSGPAAREIILRAVVGTDTLDKGVAYPMEEISHKQWMIPRLDVGLAFQHYSPEPQGDGEIILDGRQLAPQKFELYLEFNPQDVEVHYFEQLIAEARIIDETLPGLLESRLMEQVMKRLGQYLEYGFFNSHTAFDPTLSGSIQPVAAGYPDNTLQSVFGAYFYNGFIAKALADSTVQKLPYVAGYTSPTTLRANVLDPLYALLLNNPLSQGLIYKYGEKGLRYLFSYANQSNYELALQRDTFKNIRADEKAYIQYRNYDTVPLAGLIGDTTFLTIARPDISGNLFIGMNSAKDFKLEMKRKNAWGDYWFIKGIFKLDANHGFGDQMALYTPITQ